MSEMSRAIAKVPLFKMAAIDAEVLSPTTSPSVRFKYIDISAVSENRLTLPDTEINFADAPSRARRVLRSGDVLMSTVRPNLKAFAYCKLDDASYVASTGFAVLRAYEQSVPYFLLCAILSDEVGKQIDSLAVGSNYPAINSSDVRRLLIPNYSLVAQYKIASILSTIDTAIEQTEALIEKYQHIKAGLMHDLFTRGVLPTGQLRPPRDQAPELYQETAIGWIPREWRLCPLGEMANIVSGVTLGAIAGPSDTINAPYLRVANVQDGYLDLSEIKTVRVSSQTLEHLRLQPGDVLMNEGGDFDKLGRGAVWRGQIENCVHQNHVFRVRCNASVLASDYLAYYSESAFGKKYFVMSSKQSTNLASINSTQLKAYPIALPPLGEQTKITLHVQRAKSRQEALTEEVKKLRAQKLGLMQDLLTGKVSVLQLK